MSDVRVFRITVAAVILTATGLVAGALWVSPAFGYLVVVAFCVAMSVSAAAFAWTLIGDVLRR